MNIVFSVKATQVAVKSSHSKFAVDIQKLGAQHYEVCVQRCFKAIRETFSEEGILEEMAKLHNLAEEQKQFKDTHLRSVELTSSYECIIIDIMPR